jgi:hypothetical protein
LNESQPCRQRQRLETFCAFDCILQRTLAIRSPHECGHIGALPIHPGERRSAAPEPPVSGQISVRRQALALPITRPRHQIRSALITHRCCRILQHGGAVPSICNGRSGLKKRPATRQIPELYAEQVGNISILRNRRETDQPRRRGRQRFAAKALNDGMTNGKTSRLRTIASFKAKPPTSYRSAYP